MRPAGPGSGARPAAAPARAAVRARTPSLPWPPLRAEAWAAAVSSTSPNDGLVRGRQRRGDVGLVDGRRRGGQPLRDGQRGSGRRDGRRLPRASPPRRRPSAGRGGGTGALRPQGPGSARQRMRKVGASGSLSASAGAGAVGRGIGAVTPAPAAVPSTGRTSGAAGTGVPGAATAGACSERRRVSRDTIWLSSWRSPGAILRVFCSWTSAGPSSPSASSAWPRKRLARMLSGASRRAVSSSPALRRVAGVQEGPPERQPRRGVRRVLRQPGARHPDGVRVIPRLPVLLGQLREEPRTRVALEPATEFVDAGVSHGHKARGRPAPGRPRVRAYCGRALGYHRWRISTVRSNQRGSCRCRRAARTPSPSRGRCPPRTRRSPPRRVSVAMTRPRLDRSDVSRRRRGHQRPVAVRAEVARRGR